MHWTDKQSKHIAVAYPLVTLLLCLGDPVVFLNNFGPHMKQLYKHLRDKNNMFMALDCLHHVLRFYMSVHGNSQPPNHVWDYLNSVTAQLLTILKKGMLTRDVQHDKVVEFYVTIAEHNLDFSINHVILELLKQDSPSKAKVIGLRALLAIQLKAAIESILRSCNRAYSQALLTSSKTTIDAVTKEKSQGLTVGISTYAKASLLEDQYDNLSVIPSAVDIKSSGVKHFKSHWSKGEPVVVSNVLSIGLGLSWEHMVDTNLHSFFKWYTEGRYDGVRWPHMLKLKDCSPSKHHAIKAILILPLKEYTHPRDGYLNLATKLPRISLKPDMGPKIQIGYGFAQELGHGDSVTKLHFNMWDVVNILTHTAATLTPNLEQLECINNYVVVLHDALRRLFCIEPYWCLFVAHTFLINLILYILYTLDTESGPLEDLREIEIPQPLLVVPSPVPSSDDLHLIVGHAHAHATVDTESEPEEAPSEIEEFLTLVSRAHLTDEEFEASELSDTRITSSHSTTLSDSTTLLSPDHPLTKTIPTHMLSRPLYYHRTARIAVRTEPTLSPGFSARLIEAMTLSPSSFRKRYISCYGRGIG
ncbi:furry homolog-like protein, partial [Tanacetum coccineum]